MSSSNFWIKSITHSGTIRAIGIEATQVVTEIATSHKLSGPHAQALGEVVIGALMVGSYCKRGERININIQSTGILKQAIVDSRPDGTVRGYAIANEFALEDASKGLWGDGLLAVLRTKDSEGQQPYIGTVPLVTGHFAKDLTFYWLQSEQVPTATGITVLVKDDKIYFAGGFLVQAMPGATDAEVLQIQRQIQHYNSYAQDYATHRDPKQVLAHIFQDTSFVILEEAPVTVKCDCSLQRVERALRLVGTPELQKMIQEDQGAEVNCDFCTKKYRLDAENLQRLIRDSQSH